MTDSLRDKITICIFTHIINANTNPYLKNDMLIETIRSVKEDLGLIDVRYRIYCDAYMKRAYPDLTNTYFANIRSMIKDAGLDDLDLKIVENTGETLRGSWECAIGNMKTPYMMFLEHDWRFINPLDMNKIINTFDKCEKISYLRFNRLDLDGRPLKSITNWEWWIEPENDLPESEIPLSRISFYSGNPHIERVSAMKEFYIPILEMKQPDLYDRSFLERAIKPLTEQCINDYGKDKTHEMWGTYMYGTEGHEAIVEHTGEWCRKA